MVYIGIDVGGTTAKAGVVDEGGNILYKASCPTGIERSFEDIAADMVALCRRVVHAGGQLLQRAGVGGFGHQLRAQARQGAGSQRDGLLFQLLPVPFPLGRQPL